MAKKTSNKELYEKAYDVALNKEAKRLGVVKKRKLTIALTAIAVVAAAGAGYAGYSIYKNINDNKLENRLVVDPSAQESAKISELNYNEKGDAICSVVAKNPSVEKITGVVVFIGQDKLVQGDEYDAYEANLDESSSWRVEIKKEALNKHSGKVTVSPTVSEITYNVEFKCDDGHAFLVAPKTQEVKKGKTAFSPTAESTTGEVAVAWRKTQTSQEDFNFSTPINESIVLYPRWLLVESHSVKFYSDIDDEATVFFQQEVIKDSLIAKPEIPESVITTHEGKHVEGWYTEPTFQAQNMWDFDTDTVTADLKLYPKWVTNTYTVSYNLNGGTGDIPSPVTDVPYNGTIAQAPTAPTKTGATFAGWYTAPDDTGTRFYHANEVTQPTEPSKVISSLTLYAHWNVLKVTITANVYEETGGTITKNPTTLSDLEYGHLVTLIANPSEGYEFEGWYKKDDQSQLTKIDDATATYSFKASENIALVVKFKKINNLKVTCDAAGGTFGESAQTSWDNIEYGSTISPEPSVTKTDCTFEGWYYDDGTGTSKQFIFGDEVNDATPVTGNWTLTARWKATTKHVVSFDANGGTFVTAQIVEDGKKIALSPESTRPGYILTYWHIGSETGNIFLFGSGGTVVTQDYKLVASWKDKVSSVTITCPDITGTGGAGEGQCTAKLYDSKSAEVTDAVGTVSYAITDSGETTGVSIDASTGKITCNTATSGTINVQATYTPKDGTAAKTSTEIAVDVEITA